MGGGDLNMKKSWHPLLIKNQERVWKEEQKAAEEGKKLAQLKKELEEERYLQELKKLQEGKGGNERLEWMYASAASHSNSAKAQETEDFLLGKKRVDSLVEQGTSLSRLSADSKDIFMDTMNPNANSYKDIQSKIRDDPLFHIKKIEQAHIKAIVNNPLKLKRLQEKTKKKDKDKKKDRKDKKHKKIDKERKNKSSDNNNKRHY